MAVSLLPGAVLAAVPQNLALAPTPVSITAGTSQTWVVTVGGVSNSTFTADTTLAIVSDGTATAPVFAGTSIAYPVNSMVPGATCSLVAPTCTATLAGTYLVTGTNTLDTDSVPDSTFVAHLTVTAATATSLTVAGLTSPVTSPAADAGTVTASDQYGNVVKTFVGSVYLSSSDPSATYSVPLTAFANGVAHFSINFVTSGTQSVTAIDSISGISGTQSGIVVNGTAALGSTYHPLPAPVRILDTRYYVGLYGRLSANVPITFAVAGVGGVPAETTLTNVTAVTGNLTVATPSGGWAVYLGPAPVVSPTTSTINFVAGQTTSNGVTVALSSDGNGTLSATYIASPGSTTDLVFDVTGYFTNVGTAGDYYTPIAPTRAVDTRTTGAPLLNTAVPLVANMPVCWSMNSLTGGVAAAAVTGNVTVTDATSGWAIALGPTNAAPTTSTLNFTGGRTVANGVTVALGTGTGAQTGAMCATFISTPGNTADLVFDLTGSYKVGVAEMYWPITPLRIVDSRYAIGVSSSLSANTPRTFQVGNVGTISATAKAITGNLTMVNETSGWAAFLGPNPVVSPASSTVNFSAGQIISNGVTVQLSALYYLSATYISAAGNKTDMVLDVSGYFQ